MPENQLYPPEGLRPPVPLDPAALREAAETGAILEGTALRCGADRASVSPWAGSGP